MKSPWWAPNPETQQEVIIVKHPWKKFAKRAITIIIISTLLFLAGQNPGRTATIVGKLGIENPPSIAALLDSCSGIINWKSLSPKEIGYAPATSGGRFYYRVLPPVSGNYNQYPANMGGKKFIAPTEGKLTPKPSQVLNNLAHGWVAIWYLDSLDKASRIDLQNWANSQKDSRIIVSPWLGNLARWHTGKEIIYTRWGQSQECVNFSRSSVAEFLAEPHSVAPATGLDIKDPGKEITHLTGPNG